MEVKAVSKVIRKRFAGGLPSVCRNVDVEVAVGMTVVLLTFLFSGCALTKPKAATDPAYIAAFQKERRFWERRVAQVFSGMTRDEADQILPLDKSLPGILGGGPYVSAGKTRPQAHTEEWYYLSPHFICNIEYDFTGMRYPPPDPDDGITPEFPVGPTSENRVIGGPTVTLVEPGRVKKPRPGRVNW